MSNASAADAVRLVPSDYVLVPREPTGQMLKAAFAAMNATPSGTWKRMKAEARHPIQIFNAKMRPRWEAMLAAAPAPATARGGDALRIAVEALERAQDRIDVTRGLMGSFYRTESSPESLYEAKIALGIALAALASQPQATGGAMWPQSEGEVPPCGGCGQSSRSWHGVNRLWNLVMGGPDATDDPGGILCPNCFIDRAAATGNGRRWIVTDVDPDEATGGAVEREIALDWRKVETTALEEWRSEFGDYDARVVLGHDNVWSYRVNNSGHLGFASADEAKQQALAAMTKRLTARLAAARETVALYAALATQPAPSPGGWRTDFENAPTDGSVFLVGYDDETAKKAGLFANKDRVYEARWNETQATWSARNGFILHSDSTHWQPLPAAPSIQKGDEG